MSSSSRTPKKENSGRILALALKDIQKHVKSAQSDGENRSEKVTVSSTSVEENNKEKSQLVNRSNITSKIEKHSHKNCNDYQTSATALHEKELSGEKIHDRSARALKRVETCSTNTCDKNGYVKNHPTIPKSKSFSSQKTEFDKQRTLSESEGIETDPTNCYKNRNQAQRSNSYSPGRSSNYFRKNNNHVGKEYPSSSGKVSSFVQEKFSNEKAFDRKDNESKSMRSNQAHVNSFSSAGGKPSSSLESKYSERKTFNKQINEFERKEMYSRYYCPKNFNQGDDVQRNEFSVEKEIFRNDSDSKRVRNQITTNKGKSHELSSDESTIVLKNDFQTARAVVFNKDQLQISVCNNESEDCSTFNSVPLISPSIKLKSNKSSKCTYSSILPEYEEHKKEILSIDKNSSSSNSLCPELRGTNCIDSLDCFEMDKKNCLEMPYIPPPLPPKPSNDSSNLIPSVLSEDSEKDNWKSLLEKEQKNFKDISEKDEGFSSVSGFNQTETITGYLKKIEKDRLVSTEIAEKILKDVNIVIEEKFPGNSIILYGSYCSDLAVSTSNLNLALKTDSIVKNSFLLEIQKCLSKELKRYQVLPFEEEVSVKKSKICIIEQISGVIGEIMYLGRSGENARKIACLLKEVCALDDRIKTMLIATRIWAEVCIIHEAEDGKLPPVAFNLLVVHFLQNLEQPILPIIDISMKDWGLESYQNSNTAEVGELWLEFLNYYRTFNWEDNVVSVVHKQPVLKTSKPWKPSWIAIEDPFSEKNVADSVTSLDVANFIKSCFSKFYNYFSLPPDELAESNVKNPEGHMKQECKKRRYSFSSCELQDIPVCERCEEYGVTCEDCLISPSKVVQELPELSSSSMEKVDQVLQEICKDYALPLKRIEARKAFVQDLETYVRKIYPRARLTLFGSSVNGFGFKKSDLDICLTFEGCKKENINIQRTMCVLKRHLRRNEDFENVFILSRAQIPIIKFNYTPGKFICDISFYNILAIHNSTLLRTYSLLDERCQILGCAFKYMAKKAFIADTLIKTLSSYSYILMVIHYLQQIEPPVLPVLSIQDEKVFEENLVIPVETARKHNWLCKDIQSLKNIYNKGSRNKLTAGQLWLGLLKFYLQVNSDYVISIKHKEAVPISSLPRSAALYNIEDPFLVKNLGCIVSQMKASVIWNTLNRARLLFGKEISFSGKDLKEYYFSSMNLTGRYVAEELCTLCGKYGHSKAKCPHNLNYV